MSGRTSQSRGVRRASRGSRTARARSRTRCRARPGPALHVACGRRAARGGRDADLAAGPVPGRDPVAPPELPRDAPVLDVLHQVVVGLLPLVGDDLRPVPCSTAIDGRLASGFLTNHCVEIIGSTTAAALAAREREHVRLGLARAGPSRRARAFTAGARLACGRARRRARRCRSSRPVEVEDVISSSLWRLPVAKSLKSCAGVTLTAPVPNFGSTRTASVTMGISRPERGCTSFLPWRSCSAGRRGARRPRCRRAWSRGGWSATTTAPALPASVPDDRWSSCPCPVLVLDLEVGERRAALGAPVDEPRRAVDEPLLVQAHEGLAHRAVHVRVHREPLARPVRRCAQHRAARGCGRRSRPSTPTRARRTPRGRGRGGSCPRLASCALDHDLGGDARVVGAGLPERVVARACGATG